MPLHQHPIAFPKLVDAQVAALGKFATLKSFQAGEALFTAGEHDFKFFVVKRAKLKSSTVPRVRTRS